MGAVAVFYFVLFFAYFINNVLCFTFNGIVVVTNNSGLCNVIDSLSRNTFICDGVVCVWP